MIWILFFLGIGFTCMTVVNMYLGLSAKNWPSTTGKVLVSEILARKSLFDTWGANFFRPILVYEYCVNGKTYRSTRLDNRLTFEGDREFADYIVSRYGPNSQVKVYYHSWFPGISALLPGMQQLGAHSIFLLLGLVVSVSSGLTLFYLRDI